MKEKDVAAIFDGATLKRIHQEIVQGARIER